MTTKKDELRPGDPDADARSAIIFHRRAPDASLEKALALAGIITLNGPIPDWDIFEDGNDCERIDARG